MHTKEHIDTMGIFFDHGIMLAARNVDTDMIVPIVCSQDLDERLSKSAFFYQQKNEWFDIPSLLNKKFDGCSVRKVDPHVHIDIELRPEEKERCESFWREKASALNEDGKWRIEWFETLSRSDTKGATFEHEY